MMDRFTGYNYESNRPACPSVTILLVSLKKKTHADAEPKLPSGSQQTSTSIPWDPVVF